MTRVANFQPMQELLSPEDRGYLMSLVRMDIRKKTRDVLRFEPRPGQDPEEAAAILREFREHVEFRVGVLGRLKGL